MECDFCSDPNPAWVYECADQQTDTRIVTTRVVGAVDYRNRHHAARSLSVQSQPGGVQMWGQRWAACDGCAALIEQRDVYALISRVTDSLPAKYRRGNRLPQLRGQLHATYSTVLTTLKPGRARITGDHPRGEWQPPAAGQNLAAPTARPAEQPDDQ